MVEKTYVCLLSTGQGLDQDGRGAICLMGTYVVHTNYAYVRWHAVKIA